MSIRIKSTEWKVAYAISGIIDLIQIVIAFTGVGIAINEIADIVIGAILCIYFFLRGFSPTKHLNLYLSLLGVAVLEEFTGGVAPAWTFDIYNAQRIARNEATNIEEQKKLADMLNNNVRQPLNENGVRRPPQNMSTAQIGNKPPPINLNGIRRASPPPLPRIR